MFENGDAISRLEALVEAYSSNRDEFRRGSYNETSLRVEFLNPLFKLLGWDVDNEAGKSLYAREVIHESNVAIADADDAHSNKKPDYAFRIAGETQFFLEAKKPQVNILTNPAPAFQARRYGWSGNHRIVVLSNFEDTAIYDCSYKPKPDQQPSFARIARYHYDQLVDHFGELSAIVSKDAVLHGSLESIDAKESIEKEPFGDFFLSQIRDWRYEIARDVYEHYDNVRDDDLNRFTQSILDRVIFLRVCEDRAFGVGTTLLSISTYEDLKKLFADADVKFDSGLFDYLDDAPWTISPEVLSGIFKALYFPDCSYAFNVVQPHVIGQIYEQFLSENLTIEDGWVIFSDVTEVADSDGVVPTPKEITDIIVNMTLEKKGYPCRVADICCGSGNFLISAFENLMAKELERMIAEDDPNLVERTSGYDLPFAMKRKILTNCIYGVDINPLAVEVAKLNLNLRLLEGCNASELDAFRAQTGLKLLPDLSENIKCGNSIVDSAFYQFDQRAQNDIAILRDIRPFDWNDEFAPCQFDAVVGNPPYIRVQAMKKYRTNEYDFIRSGFCKLTTTKESLVDKYQIFIDRALSLLNKDGFLGMIVPNKFMTITTGKSLRGLLSKSNSIVKLVDFGAVQVFPGRLTYTCIFVATPSMQETFDYQKVLSLPDFVAAPSEAARTYFESELGEDPWSFPPAILKDHLSRLEAKCDSLESLAKVFVGLQTSNDNAYVIQPKRKDGSCYVFDSLTGREAKVEEPLCRPCLLDVPFECYAQPKPNTMIIFPYELVGSSWKPIPLSSLKESAPHAFAYFKSIEEQLRSRSMKPIPDEESWHRFGRSQSLNRFNGTPHIIWTVMSQEPKYEIDYTGRIMFTGGGNGPFYGLELKDDTAESIEYIAAVLCYWFTEAIIRYKTSVFNQNYYSHGKQFVQGLPIRRIDFADASEKSKHDEITRLVKQVNNLISKRDEARNGDDKTLYARSILAEEKKITCIMNDLYQTDASLERALTE